MPHSTRTRTFSGHRTPTIFMLGCLSALLGCAGSHESQRAYATAHGEPRHHHPEHARAGQHEVVDPVTRTQAECDGVVSPHDPTEPRNAAERREDRREHVAEVNADRAYVAKSTPNPVEAPRSSVAAVPADNTARNSMAVAAVTPTPIDQSNSAGDIKLAASIRRAVVGDDALSFTAKNIKIIAADGQVTLRGPVKSAVEKSKVEGYAQKAAGAGHVRSDIAVEP